MSLIQFGKLRSIAMLLSSNALAALINAGGTILVSRLVTPIIFGHYSYAAQLALSIYPALNLRYDQALPLLGKHRVARTYLLIANLSLSITSAFLLLLVGKLVIAFFAPTLGLDPVMIDLFPMVVLMAFSLSLSGIYQSASLATGSLTRMANARVLRALVMVLLQVFFVLTIGAGVTWLIVADLAANLMQAIVLGSGIGLAGIWALVRRPRAQLWLRVFALVKRHKVFPFITLPHMLVFSGLGLLHSTVIGALYGAEALGNYYLMRKLIFGVLGLFSVAIYQHSIAEAAQVSKTMVHSTALRALILIGGVTIASSGVIVLFGSELFFIVAGNEWAMAGKMAVASVSLILMEPVTSTLAFVVVFLGLQRVAFAVAIVQSACGVIAIVIASKLEWSVIGAISASSLMMSAVMFVYVLWLLQRTRGVQEGQNA